MTKIISILILLFACSSTEKRRSITSGVEFSNGLIPLEYGARPATDLIYKGELLLPDDAHKMVMDSGNTFDLSKLDPDETSVLWKNKEVLPLNNEDDKLDLNEEKSINYEDLVPSRSGRIRFNVSQTGDDGVSRTYIIMASKQIHNILLNKNLLRKLGYQIPPIRYLKKIKLKFSSSISKDVFFSDLSSATFGDPTRWIPDYEEHLRAEDRIKDEDQKESYKSFLELEKKQITNSNKCISRDLEHGSKKALSGPCDTFLGTNWIIEDKENNFIAIKSPFSGKCLDVFGASKFNKARVMEHECNYKGNQLFEKIVEEGGTFVLKAKHSGKCLSFRKGKILQNRLVQVDCENTPDQKWALKDMVSNDGKLIDSEELEMQDVVAMASQDFYYNLAMGFLTDDIIKGRRILNSLLVPYSMVDLPESVNLLNWHAGRIINKQLKLDFDIAENFSTSFEDAKWITRRILKLKREDFKEIVQKAYFPEDVEVVLIEKLIARRNNLQTLLSLEGEEIEVNTDISNGEFLKNGKLLKENYPGYASRFSFGDPESPLSGTEIGNFIGSTVISQALGGVLNYVGSEYLNNQKYLESAYINHQKELYKDRLFKWMMTGIVENIPVGVWAYPTFGGSLIFSRDVVIGNYLGTDNKVQLADVVGFTVNAGVYATVSGLTTPVPLSITGSAQVNYSRTFSHLKPIASFKASFKYPFRNMIVPYLQRKQGREFLNLLNSGKLRDLKEEERQNTINETMEKFKKELSVGESLIITDSLVFGASASVGTGFEKVIKLSGQIGATNITLFRLHILRKDENTIHVYKDLGNITAMTLAFRFRAVAPVLDLSVKMGGGYARTKYYSIDISASNASIVENIQALKGLFRSSSLEILEKITKPYIIKHRFKEANVNFGLPVFSITNLNDMDQIEVQHPTGAKKIFFQTNEVYRRGVNIEEFIVDTLNGVLGQFTETGINLSGISKGSPADSILGSAFLYSSTFEGELTDPYRDGIRKKGELSLPYGSITKNFRGFIITKDKAKKILDELNKKYALEFYPEKVLSQTKNIFLYEIALNIYIYENGINHFSNLTEEEFSSLLVKYVIGHAKGLKMFQMINRFKLYKYHMKRNNYEKYSFYGRALLTLFDRYLSLEGFKEMLGGDSNFFIYSRISGFRNEDEAGDTAIMSSSIGQFGSEKVMGPITSIAEQMGMTPSEFFAYWIRTRVN
jgi:hypothetical protein